MKRLLKASLIPVFTFRYVSIWLVVLPWHSILSYLANAFMICVKLMIAVFISSFQNLFLYGYGAIFNFLGLVITAIIQGNYWECMSTWKQRAYCIVVLKCSIELSKVVNYSRLYKYYFFRYRVDCHTNWALIFVIYHVKGLYFDSNACSCEIERSSFFWQSSPTVRVLELTQFYIWLSIHT